MTANIRAPYIWSVSWGVDGAMVALPERDVVDWVLDVGGLDDDMSPIPTDGTVTLHHADGRYSRPGTYTAAQITETARWEVTASAQLQGCGRMVPAPSLPLIAGPPQPRTWLLESDATPALESRGRWRIPEGDLTTAAAAISAAAGVTVATQRGATITAAADLAEIDWSGTLAGLLGRLARIVAGWAPQQHDGTILLVSSSSAHVELVQGAVHYRSAILDAANTRVGLRTDLARTVTVVPLPTDEDPLRRIVQVTGAVSRYGRSATVIERWAGVEQALRAGYVAAEPWEEIEIALIDARRDNTLAEIARLVRQCQDVRPGNVITATLPDLAGAEVVRRCIVAGIRLTGGYGPPPRRDARLVVTHTYGGDVELPPVEGLTGTGQTVTPPRLVLDGADVHIHWAATSLGNADVARRALNFPPGDAAAAAGAVIAADAASPQTDTPGTGAWQYRLRVPPTDGDWGPWRTIAVARPPTPQLTAAGTTVTVAWPETLAAVDIRRVSGLVRTAPWAVIAAAEAGTVAGLLRTHDDSGLNAEHTYYYSIRHPTSTGQWSEPARITTGPAPSFHVLHTLAWAPNDADYRDDPLTLVVRPSTIIGDRVHCDGVTRPVSGTEFVYISGDCSDVVAEIVVELGGVTTVLQAGTSRSWATNQDLRYYVASAWYVPDGGALLVGIPSP